MTRASPALRVCAALLLAPLTSRLTAQVAVGFQAGVRYSSALVHDSIVAPFDVRPGLGPAVAVTVATSPERRWATAVTLDFSTGQLVRRDADGSSTNLGRVSTLSLTVGVSRQLAAGFIVRAGVGGLKYLPSEDSGIFRLGSGSLAGLGALTLGHVLPLGPGRHLSVEASYDLHPFTTPALRAEGFDSSRLVHRLALALRTDWGGGAGR